MEPLDTLGRPLRDLRISVTDRCNFRCTYCMPREVFGRDYAFLPRDQVLSFEEIERATRAFVTLGVEKLRITGGEPLVRRGLPDLIAMLAALRTPDGKELDLTLTTNGAALRALARPLKDAGLQRVTVSLDSLDDAVFGAMNGIDFPVARVLDGIDAALAVGLRPIKINMVVRRGINDHSVVPMARWARDLGVTLRFIEYMDVGHSNGWRLDEVVPAAELITAVTAAWRWPVDGATWMGRANSGSSRRSRCRSVGTAPGRGWPPMASCTPACLPWKVAMFVPCCATDPPMRRSWHSSPIRGGLVTTGTRSCARCRPGRAVRTCPRWRCSRWVARTVIHRVIHTRRQVVDRRRTIRPRFVDNCVDPPCGGAVP